MKLILARHGETSWNTEFRLQGQEDSPLTPRGEQQSAALAERFREIAVDVLYASDLGRARQTAGFVERALGIEARVEPLLRERHLGIFQGLTRREAAERFPVEYGRYARNEPGFGIPDGESVTERQERCATFLREVVARHGTEKATVAAVTHGEMLEGVFRHLGKHSLETPLEALSTTFLLPNCGWNECEWTGAEWEIRSWGDIAHLASLSVLNAI